MREWKSGRKKKEIAPSIKPLLVLITASCLCSCWVPWSAAELISSAPVDSRLFPFTRLPSHSLGATHEVKAHLLTLVKQEESSRKKLGQGERGWCEGKKIRRINTYPIPL